MSNNRKSIIDNLPLNTSYISDLPYVMPSNSNYEMPSNPTYGSKENLDKLDS